MNQMDNQIDKLTWRTTKGRIIPAFFGKGQFHIAGIVNVTPDSFSDGGNFLETEKALTHAFSLLDDGADSLDFGAESTRPGSLPVHPHDEQERLLPVLELVTEKLAVADKETLLAVDTYHADTAAKVLERGLATVINDISGGVLEPTMLDIVAQYGAGYVIGHCPYPPAVMQQYADYDDVVAVLLRYFEKRLSDCVKAGIDEQMLVIDPCVGFAKKLEHNLAVIKAAEQFRQFGRPVYFGISRKSFLQGYATSSIIDKDMATQVVLSFLAAQCVAIHRVHNVAAARRTLQLAAALRQ